MKPLAVTVNLTTAIVGEDTITSTFFGVLRTHGTGWQISYTEESESGRSSTLLSVEGDRIALEKRGTVYFSTVFRVGKEHTSLYSVGGLAFDAVTKTLALSVKEEGGLPSLAWSYDLTLGGEARHFSLSLSLTPREVEK